MAEPARAAVASDIDPAPTPAAPAPPLEATARALLTGCAIGAALAAGNVYASLKVGIIDGGSITAALLGFSLFATFKRRGRAPYGVLENNITQTVASSAAVMSFSTGVVGPIPALALMGRSYPWWSVAAWGIAVTIVGIFAGTLLRRRLIVEEALPFPTGKATGELLETIHKARETARTPTLFLIAMMLVAAAITWLRDGRPAVIPEQTVLPFGIAGIAAGALTLGMSWSPLMLSIGAMVGVRGAGSMLLGAAIARVVLVPWIAGSGIVSGPDYAHTNGWLVWPALGLLVAGSFMPLVLGAGAVARSFRDLAFLRGARPAGSGPTLTPADDPSLSARLWTPLLAISLAAIFVLGWRVFEVHPATMLIALTVALILTIIAARATGETDMTPGGATGTLTQLSLAGRGATTSIVGGALSLATSSMAAQVLWAYRAGARVGASPRAQLTAQILGAVVGAAVIMPVYGAIVATYGLANEKMPSTSALSFKATAEAITGTAALPPYAITALVLALVVGVVLTLLGRTRFGNRLPAPTAMGVAMLIPLWLSMAAFVGAILVAVARRIRPGIDERTVMVAAAGGLAGESLTGVLILILKATGLLAR